MFLFKWLHTNLPSPVLAAVGPLAVRWYGVCLALGIVAGYLVVRAAWREQGRAEPELERFTFVAVLCGFLGARLVDVLVYERWYFALHPWEILAVWRGGLAWHGALLAFVLVVWYWVRRQPPGSVYLLLDAFAPALALGQAVGRWGNYFNQELFGAPTTLPWSIPIAPEHRPPGYDAVVYFHPAFLYESVALVLLAVVLWRLRHKLKPGQLFALYLVCSGLLRFGLEFVRLDTQDVILWGVRAGSVVATLVVFLGVYLWVNLAQPQVITPRA